MDVGSIPAGDTSKGVFIDVFIESFNPEATYYFRLGFYFKLLRTSLGYERVQQELEGFAVVLERRFIAAAGLT